MNVTEKERDMLVTAVERLRELPRRKELRIATDWEPFTRLVADITVGSIEDRRVTRGYVHQLKYAAERLANVANIDGHHDCGTITLSHHLYQFADSLPIGISRRDISPEFAPRTR